ncbi:MAG: hypothetical protein JWQ17_1442 [Tardiphaga sp.]|jgi:hypothetical protein|nr:hypothetical protein [Tardiphaga sp.]
MEACARPVKASSIGASWPLSFSHAAPWMSWASHRGIDLPKARPPIHATGFSHRRMTIDRKKTSILRKHFVQSWARRSRTLMVSLAIRQLERWRANLIPWIPCSPTLGDRGCERRFNKAGKIHLHADLSRFSPLVRHHFDASRRTIAYSSEICPIRTGAGSALFGPKFEKQRPRCTIEVTAEDDGGKPAGGRRRA